MWALKLECTSFENPPRKLNGQSEGMSGRTNVVPVLSPKYYVTSLARERAIPFQRQPGVGGAHGVIRARCVISTKFERLK